MFEKSLAGIAALASFCFAGSSADAAPASSPRLIVMVSVDQFSADLFDQYRNRFTGGFRRLLDGAVFPNGYQSHATTRTCPGHSTLMTGYRPANTGIVSNEWYDGASPTRGFVYCAEDETQGTHIASDKHLKVPTLGERLKAVDPGVRVVSVAGKDDAAIMMGGHKIDQLWFWRDGKGFTSYADRVEPEEVRRANAEVAAEIAKPAKQLSVPAWCQSLDREVMSNGRAVGAGHFARLADDASAWKASPHFDRAIVNLATSLVKSMQLGRGKSVDVLTIGASATDYIGHAYGTGGAEMCIQLANLDATLGTLFDALDSAGVDYVIGLAADHGGNDIPERARERAMPMADRMSPALSPKAVGKAIAVEHGWADGDKLLVGSVNENIWLTDAVPAPLRPEVLVAAVARYRASPQVAAVFTADEIAASPLPHSPPETWTLLERVRASFHSEHSGDLVVILKPRITAIASGTAKDFDSIATHGSPWDYDRRVPILFWRKGMARFEQPVSVETVDIMPTFAALVGLRVDSMQVDGRCLDLDAGPGDSCQQ